MTHAYSAAYLSNAKELLSSFFDYAINDCHLKPDWITALFVNTGYAKQFERGNPAYIAGMSGVELARAVIVKAYGSRELSICIPYITKWILRVSSTPWKCSTRLRRAILS